jgi:hypothetical protein
MQCTINKKHISKVCSGDTIFHQGEIKTLGDRWISHCPFMGKSIWGDSYHSGYKPVIVLTDIKCNNMSKLEKKLKETL